ncbi:MAG: hypothetical protein H3C48_04170 [Chitinophagaceae bacterium]|nr:hypothetical protein [Chitinophagaceae bacterium]
MLGLSFLIFTCYLLSNNKREINWKLVAMGVFAQVMFAMGVLNTQIGGQPAFWIFFGIILAYIVAKKWISDKKNTIISVTIPILLVGVLWQLIFFFGIVLQPSKNNQQGLLFFISIVVLGFYSNGSAPKISIC